MLDARQDFSEDPRVTAMLDKLHGDSRLSVQTLRVAYFMLMPVDKGGFTRAPLDRLAELSHQDVEGVKRSILHLQKLGYLSAILPTDADAPRRPAEQHTVH
jgi:hypothetical protein